jgi:hypothetical protein
MAEVRIEGGGELDGAILKGAATEATLQQLVKALGGAGTAAGAAAQNLGKQAPKTLSELTKETKGATKAFNDFKVKHNAAREAIQDFSVNIIKGSDKFGDFTSSLTGYISQMGFGYALLAQGLQRLVDELDQQIVRFQQLSTVGADFGDSIFASRYAAIDAGLSLEEFKGQVESNAGTFALLGGSTIAGVRRFQSMSRVIQRDLQPTFSRLGLSMSETNDLMTDYLEIQTGLGRAQEMSNEDLVEGTKNYIQELDLLARVTGMSRKEASEALKAQQKDRNLRSLMMSMPAELQTQLGGMLASISKTSPQIADAVKELVITGGSPISDTAKGLMFVDQNLGNMARGLRDGSVTQEEFSQALQRAAIRAKEQGAAMGANNALIGFMGNEILTVGADLAQFGKFADARAEAEKAQLKASETGSKSVADFSSQMTKLTNSLIALFAPFLEGVTAVASYLTSVVSALANMISKSEGVGKVLVGLAGAAVAAGVALKAISVGRGMVGGVKNFFAGGGGTTTGGGGGSKVLEGIGKSGGGLGAGLKGFASGLTAFANPAVLLGAAGLGTAIVLIGAGIAGAAWLMGGAFGKFADDMQKFNSIDGQNLKSVASGAMALSGAMANFGVSGIAAGFGKLFGGGGESLAKNINATLDSLDKDKIDSYTTALNGLSESFAGLNNNMTKSISASGKSSSDKLDELNMTMRAVLDELQTGKRYQKRTAENTEELT